MQIITIKDIGDFESVPGIVSDIINGDTLALDKHLSEGFDIEEDISMITKKSLELQRKYAILLTLSVNCVAFCVSFINTLYKTTELSGKTIRQVVHKNIQ